MEIRVEQLEDSVIIAPEGEVDLSNSRELQLELKRVLKTKPTRLVVDLSQVLYMDSSGVATLVEAMQIARRQSTDLVLCTLQPKVQSVFEIARLDRVFRITKNVETARVK